jgi:hypothetical protein
MPWRCAVFVASIIFRLAWLQQKIGWVVKRTIKFVSLGMLRSIDNSREIYQTIHGTTRCTSSDTWAFSRRWIKTSPLLQMELWRTPHCRCSSWLSRRKLQGKQDSYHSTLSVLLVEPGETLFSVERQQKSLSASKTWHKRCWSLVMGKRMDWCRFAAVT